MLEYSGKGGTGDGPVGPDTPITQLAGVGEARAKKLAKLGLAQAADLLTYYPRDYEDRRKIYALREAPVGQRVCVAAMAAEHPRKARIRQGLELVQLKVVDHTGALQLKIKNWFFSSNETPAPFSGWFAFFSLI